MMGLLEWIIPPPTPESDDTRFSLQSPLRNHDWLRSPFFEMEKYWKHYQHNPEFYFREFTGNF